MVHSMNVLLACTSGKSNKKSGRYSIPQYLPAPISLHVFLPSCNPNAVMRLGCISVWTIIIMSIGEAMSLMLELNSWNAAVMSLVTVAGVPDMEAFTSRLLNSSWTFWARIFAV